jgi:DNA mismatch repair protein MutS
MPSPARQQYLKLKQCYPDTILLYRLGDFYEMFDEDAEVAARVLRLTLTSREFARGEGRVPMAGIPHHTCEGYIRRLIEAGYKVAICEQLSEPGKGLVERDVIRVVTPGTVVEPAMLEATANNYLAAVFPDRDGFGLAYVDVTTGEFAATEFSGSHAEGELEAELLRLTPAECLVPEGAKFAFAIPTHLTPYAPYHFDYQRAARTLYRQFEGEISTSSASYKTLLAAFGCEDKPLAVSAAGAIIAYLAYTNQSVLQLLTGLRTYSTGAYMALDRYTRSSLELTQSTRGGGAHGSLLWVLDRTKTPMGARLLRVMVGQPLLEVARINRRLDAVEELYRSPILRAQLAQTLAQMGDVERLAGRVSSGIAHRRDLLALRDSLKAVEMLRDFLSPNCEELRSVYDALDPCSEVSDLISSAVQEESDRPLIRPGYSAELDELIASTRHAREYIAKLEAVERERTGIKSLKVGYNKVFGYYIEVSNANTALVPENYIRKQTLVNAERYITPELKEYEAQVLHAEERIQQLETELFNDLLKKIAVHLDRIMNTAGALARLDVYRSLAEVAAERNYTRPTLDEGEELLIIEGRHPVVEVTHSDEAFVPNDCRLNTNEQQIIILTGPNMGGKSTMLRMVALVVLMAQIGSFVPAKQAHVGIVDRVFSRVGAQDDIAAGQSTFMVEMVETANILHHATRRSLLILDEIGRGTSTYDGLAIARAVIEYIHARIGARTLFATHYHELTELADELDRVYNYHVTVAEQDGKVIFLHKVTPGGIDRSYGIHVARLAGLPRSVTIRAERILRELERIVRNSRCRRSDVKQLALFGESEPLDSIASLVLDELLALDLPNMTPLQALEALHKLQERGRSGA